MRSAAKHVVSFLTVMIPIFHCQVESCVLPLRGRCAQTNYTAADNLVCPPVKANCSFSDGEQPCDYKQGCMDPGMTNWTVVNGTAQAKQIGSPHCGRYYYYSVLESPWLEFTVTSCLKFSYRRYLPAALDVFLARHNGSVITILDRTQNFETEGTVTSYTETINAGIVKIQFRAYGGGGGSPGTVDVYPVSVFPGHCGLSAGGTTTVASNTDPAAPGSSAPTDGNCRPLTTTTTTPLTTASTTHQDKSSRSSYPVTTSDTPSLRTSLAVDTRDKQTSQADIPDVTDQHSEISTFTSREDSASKQPQGSTSDDPHSNNNDQNGSGFDIVAIAGAAAAAAVVTAVAVVAVVIFCRRRRLKSEPDKDKDNMEDMTEMVKDSSDLNASGDTNVGKSHSTPSQPPAAVVYVNVDGPTSNNHDEDIDPYDLEAEDGAPGKNRNSSRTDYNGVHTRGALKQNVGPPSTAENVEDDYNHMISAKSTPQSRGVAEDDYSRIKNAYNTPHSVEGASLKKVQEEGQNPTQPNPHDVYSVVNKKDKTTTPSKPNPNDVYSVVNKKDKTPTPSKPNPNDVYSVVNKKDKKPKVASKPNTPENGLLPDEYNTLSFNEAHKGFAKTERMGSARTAYDHVQTDPADFYSKAQTGKRNIVIDSNYDHVKN